MPTGLTLKDLARLISKASELREVTASLHRAVEECQGLRPRGRNGRH
jgi:hypothetical protein